MTTTSQERAAQEASNRDTKPLLWSQYEHKYPSPGAHTALCSPSSQPEVGAGVALMVLMLMMILVVLALMLIMEIPQVNQ